MTNIQVICNLVAPFKNFLTISSGSETHSEGGAGDHREECVELGADIIQRP